MSKGKRYLVCLAASLIAACAIWSVQAIPEDPAGASAQPVVSATGEPPVEACSPPPECWTDRDCNKICGKKVGGTCVVVNSCYRECVCNQTR